MERQRAVQAVWEITAPRQASTKQDGPRYDWDALYDAPLGLPIELPNRVSDPRTPPTGGRESTREPVTSQRSPSTPGSRLEKETEERNDLDEKAIRGTGGQRENTLPAPVTTRKSRIPTPDPHKTTLASHRKGGHLGRDEGCGEPGLTTADEEVRPPWGTLGKRPAMQGYEPTPMGPPQQGDTQPQRLNFDTPIEGDYGPCFICSEPGHVSGRCPGGWR